MFNQNQFNNNNPYGGAFQPGMQYNQMPHAKMTQVLTPEQIKSLKATGSQFNLHVEPIEFTRALCTHKENGKIALIENNDGSVTCSVCGSTFNLVDYTPEQVIEATTMFTNILQTIKTYYLDIPESYVNEYFRMVPLLEKVPKFYDTALQNFKKYEANTQLQQGNNMYGFNMLNALTSPMYNQMGGQPQGYYNPSQQQGFNPQFNGQPQFNQQGFGQPQQFNGQQGGNNGFGYNQNPCMNQDPNQNQANMNQPFLNPNTNQAPPATNTASAANNNITTTKTYSS